MKTIEALFAGIFKIQPEQVTDHTRFTDYDSFKIIFFFTQLEKEYHIQLNLKDMVNVTDIGDLKKVMK